MPPVQRIMRSLLVAALLLCCRASAAPTSQPATAFMRFIQESDGSARLEVADAAYRNPRGVVVHLIGAVHIADPIFYEGLNENFSHYDALLYEMVKAAGSGAPMKGQKSSGWISTMQRYMKDRLGLSFQLDEIDYLIVSEKDVLAIVSSNGKTKK